MTGANAALEILEVEMVTPRRTGAAAFAGLSAAALAVWRRRGASRRSVRSRARLDPAARPIFVGGSGRSGTTIIGQWLGVHPDVVCHRTEVRFHIAAGGFTRVLDGRWSPADYAEHVRAKVYRISTADGRPKGLQLLVTQAELRDALARFEADAGAALAAGGDPRPAMRALSHELLDPYALGRGAGTWVETTPDNTRHAATLLSVFPTGHLLHAVRDGRDVAASVATQGWGPDDLPAALEWWRERMLMAHRGAAGADPARLTAVRLEELIHLDRERTREALLDRLGVVDRGALRAWFDHELDAARGHVGRWRGEVEAGERDRIDGRYREIVAELGDAGAVLPTDPGAVDDLAGA